MLPQVRRTRSVTEATEGLADIEAAEAARAGIAENGTVPWDEVKAELGLA
ncbi:prevent-host-death family protein [Actinomyces sp. Chiba101]|uniref:Uncharacterized protein n=1 Tax=Actinomyces denticolens TaxID=52767 RepID=A0ABY1HYY1_9ACTO|nr:prevent-host-death family protein [Actinomyces sp. Chiba101]GAV93530.1 hypothetical protein ADENT20671_0276 [Actinomyces denticolens]SHI33216.1 hypothetical protein SAMN05216246_101260 [Actinomyces denticolens]SUU74578.1 Uncharacterised protein [Actinomyces denticolens]